VLVSILQQTCHVGLDLLFEPGEVQHNLRKPVQQRKYRFVRLVQLLERREDRPQQEASEDLLEDDQFEVVAAGVLEDVDSQLRLLGEVFAEELQVVVDRSERFVDTSHIVGDVDDERCPFIVLRMHFVVQVL